MLTFLLGDNAFSSFAKEKIFKKISFIQSKIIHMTAKYIYFIDHSNELNMNRLNSILLVNKYEKCTMNHQSFIILPRIGIISPWSSKAIDILHNCGLTQCNKIERGILYSFKSNIILDKNILTKISIMLYDKMTQRVIFDFKSHPFMFSKENNKLNIINYLEHGTIAFNEANHTLGLALSKNDIDYLSKFFKLIGRNPTDVELMMFAQANSEHCRHKMFNAHWIINGQDKDKTLFDMIKNTYYNYKHNIFSAYNDNAAVIYGSIAKKLKITKHNNLYAFNKEAIHFQIKVETHNHPTAISPYYGAATGSGGEIRDETATGCGGKPKAGLTGYSVSNLFLPNNQQPWERSYGYPEHIASALEIMIEAPIGAARFNNEFGRPNLCGYFRTLEQSCNGTIWGYHKPIMISGGLGNIKEENIYKKNIPINSKLIILGGPGMLIGLGGGSISSELVNNKNLHYNSVQRDNAEMQNRAQEVIDRCASMGVNNPIISIHDVGAGGLSNAFPELVYESKKGAIIYLDKIPMLEKGLSPLEKWCNESQERYVLAITDKNLKLFEDIAIREKCPYAIVGKVTKEPFFILKDNNYNTDPINIPISFLFPKYPKIIKETFCNYTKYDQDAWNYYSLDLNKIIKRILRLPSVGSKNFLITICDRTVGGMTQRDQMVGPWQVPVADVAVTASSYINFNGEAISIGERPILSIINPSAAARMSLGEAITNISASYINTLSNIKISANWMAACGYKNENEKLYKMVETLGMDFCPKLNITIPVGKDSLSMKTQWHDKTTESIKEVISPLSLIISAFSPVEDIRYTLTPQISLDDPSYLILIDLGFGKNRLGGSSFAQIYNKIGNQTPDIDNPKILEYFFFAIQTLIKEKKIMAYHDRSDGGLFVTLCEMMFTSKCGIEIDINTTSHHHIYSHLFNEELGAILQIKKNDYNEVMSLLKESKLSAYIIGHPNLDELLTIKYNNKKIFSAERAELHKIWSETSYNIQRIRDNSKCADQEYNLISSNTNNGLFYDCKFYDKEKMSMHFYLNKKIKPKIAILREQGVNGQNEMAAAFTLTGFDAIDVHMSDLKSGNLNNLSEFKGLAFCGGFSYGDVLGSGTGWAKSILYDEKLLEDFYNFFNRSDTFSVGMCNGCQMLSQLRKIIPGSDNWPMFTTNLSEQFESRLVMIEILDSHSIFFKDMVGFKMPIIVAHAEGKTKYINENDLKLLNLNKKITLRFIDNCGNPTEYYPLNPNGSEGGFTGFTSNDGRVTLMMPHPERSFRMLQLSYNTNNILKNEYKEYSPWIKCFINARKWVN